MNMAIRSLIDSIRVEWCISSRQAKVSTIAEFIAILVVAGVTLSLAAAAVW